MSRPALKPRRPHPVLAFVLIVALALGAAVSVTWMDSVTQATDALTMQSASDFLPL